ncbi:hypothetical protein M5X04_14645 [Paenibacillus alvei]|uniref:Uncharacterized protein n=1 Tax=Paenibacillus alvei TaxID=44250 RepID=A0ABT4ED45_PAEAL|nr:hypothetical protein [Paenibacillus alvei]MCY9530558.1 hypothetical protein [Paenibacillus alvei]
MKVSLTINADVNVTEEVRNGLKEQYGWSDEKVKDDELVAKTLLYAYLNPRIPNKCDEECYWDGVANMNGLIVDIELGGHRK